ncbi:AAA family ATPase [Rhizobium leguminosarum]|uniref:AAA family ATPase n=1 Tax=Rhizobium leguminosarum TaxID=384 RepID=UPI001C938C76|nr:AAA family ATPase [Rhizobium leguminosarum]MBY5592871.1 AAA family ATPase [Rhizobium leguminosarum]MBY5606465.1 AAA family ATPase [Rhizobium leguminosarum]
MTPLYLRRLKLQEFRSFGQLDVPLPDGPGVLIVHGSNGLGKSSLFDGLEWALTGTIDHFPESKKKIPESQYLRRWNAAPERPTHIRLEFNGGWIGRNVDAGLDTAGEQDLVGFFRHESWQNPIEHLERYFLLTHFLGQSTVSRMTHRDNKERWEFLQEPAQSERAKELVRLLHGHGASTPALAFRRRADDLLNRAQQLQTLLNQEEGAWDAAQLEGAIDDAAAQSEAEAIATELAQAMREVGLSKPPDVRLTLNMLADNLDLLQSNANDLWDARAIQLDRARVIQRERQTAAAGRAALVKEVTETEGRVVSAEALANTARAEADRSTAALFAAREELANARLAMQSLARVADARAELGRLQIDLKAARTLGQSLLEEAKTANKRVERAHKRRRLAERLSERDRSAAAEIEALLRRRDAIEAAFKALAARDAAQAALDAEVERHPALEADLAAAAADLERAKQRVDDISDMLATARAATDAMTSALSEVSRHLQDDACACPLCGSDFDPGELQRRARAASDRLAPVIVPLQDRLSDAERERDTCEKRRATLALAKARFDAAKTNVERYTTELAKAGDTIPVTSVLTDTILADILAATELDSSLAGERRRRVNHWLNHPAIGGTAAALAYWAEAMGQSNRLASLEETQRRTISESETAFNRAEVSLAKACGDAAIPLDLSDSQIGLAHADAEAREQAAQKAESEASVAAEKANANATTAGANFAAIKTLIEQRRAHIADHDRQLVAWNEEWAALGLAGTAMADGGLDSLTEALVAARARLASTRRRIDKLRDGRVVWLRQSQQRSALNALREALDAAPVAERDALRQSARKLQADYLARSAAIQRAKTIAQDASAEVTRRVQQFNRENLRPLNRLMSQINLSILSDQAIGLDLEVNRDSIEQRAVASNAPSFVSQLDPLFVHSEGQMAALAVSMLTAASLTFPWSRWPALIMDDPLQHNDVIHAAAFADMMRNLVRERGYQIFLSTHELAEAQFLRRKFQAAAIPCTMVHLTGQGSNGVECRIDQMAQSLSKAG